MTPGLQQSCTAGAGVGRFEIAEQRTARMPVATDDLVDHTSARADASSVRRSRLEHRLAQLVHAVDKARAQGGVLSAHEARAEVGDETVRAKRSEHLLCLCAHALLAPALRAAQQHRVEVALKRACARDGRRTRARAVRRAVERHNIVACRHELVVAVSRITREDHDGHARMTLLQLGDDGAHPRQRVCLHRLPADVLAHRLEELHELRARVDLCRHVFDHDASEEVEQLGRLLRVLAQPRLARVGVLAHASAHHVVEERPGRRREADERHLRLELLADERDGVKHVREARTDVDVGVARNQR
mmetsp:Transcript_14262/g.36961  ORF Transcript_14262/g.36961 Transcript_14262/m.36961 type:complete len:303 (-) Transcript_14262:487-1395(-)